MLLRNVHSRESIRTQVSECSVRVSGALLHARTCVCPRFGDEVRLLVNDIEAAKPQSRRARVQWVALCASVEWDPCDHTHTLSLDNCDHGQGWALRSSLTRHPCMPHARTLPPVATRCAGLSYSDRYFTILAKRKELPVGDLSHHLACLHVCPEQSPSPHAIGSPTHFHRPTSALVYYFLVLLAGV